MFIFRYPKLSEDKELARDLRHNRQYYIVAASAARHDSMCLSDFPPGSTNIRSVFPNWNTPKNHHLLKVERVRSRRFAVTCLRCGGKCDSDLAANLLETPTVKKIEISQHLPKLCLTL